MNRKAKRRRESVTVHCASCGWEASASTWRPAKRLLKAHTDRRHPDLTSA